MNYNLKLNLQKKFKNLKFKGVNMFKKSFYTLLHFFVFDLNDKSKNKIEPKLDLSKLSKPFQTEVTACYSLLIKS